MLLVQSKLFELYTKILNDTEELDEDSGISTALAFSRLGITQIRKFFVAIVVPLRKEETLDVICAEIWIEPMHEDIFAAGWGCHAWPRGQAKRFVEKYDFEVDMSMSSYSLIDQDYRNILVVGSESNSNLIKRELEDSRLGRLNSFWPDLIFRYQLNQVILNPESATDFFDPYRNSSIVFDWDIFPKIREDQHYKYCLQEFASRRNLPAPTYHQLMRYRILIKSMHQAGHPISYEEVARIVYGLPVFSIYR